MWMPFLCKCVAGRKSEKIALAGFLAGALSQAVREHTVACPTLGKDASAFAEVWFYGLGSFQGCISGLSIWVLAGAYGVMAFGKGRTTPCLSLATCEASIQGCELKTAEIQQQDLTRKAWCLLEGML